MQDVLCQICVISGRRNTTGSQAHYIISQISTAHSKNRSPHAQIQQQIPQIVEVFTRATVLRMYS